jgi:hypothetical protein
MKINCKSKIGLRVIDYINNLNWLSAAISITLSGLALLWTIGLLFAFNIQNTL